MDGSIDSMRGMGEMFCFDATGSVLIPFFVIEFYSTDFPRREYRVNATTTRGAELYIIVTHISLSLSLSLAWSPKSYTYSEFLELGAAGRAICGKHVGQISFPPFPFLPACSCGFFFFFSN